MSEISVLLVDDHSLVRKGFRRILEDDPEIRVVDEAANGQEAVRLARQLHPRVIVMEKLNARALTPASTLRRSLSSVTKSWPWKTLFTGVPLALLRRPGRKNIASPLSPCRRACGSSG